MMRVLETTLLGKVTGADSPNRTDERFGIHGTDLGTMWDAGQDRVFVMFGDTYGAGWGGFGAGPRGAQWRCNVLLSSTTTDLERDGLVLNGGVSRRGRTGATQVIANHRLNLPRLNVPEHTLIPNSGIMVDGLHYVHWMSVLIWLGPGRWRTFQAGIARSDDDGRTWHKPLGGRWPNVLGRNRFQIGSFTRDDDWVYLFGTSNGRWGPAYVARVDPAVVASVRAYRYWDGSRWQRAQRRAQPVIDGPVGEMSVAHHAGMGCWLALHLDEQRGAIVLRTADSLTGPWSGGQVVVDTSQYPGLYGGYLHPWHLHGEKIYWVMSQWAPYNVFLMRSTLAD